MGSRALLYLLRTWRHIWTEQIKPAIYDAELEYRVRNRQRFADFVESEIRRLNSLDDWRGYRYAELEAEVEYEGQPRGRGFPMPPWTDTYGLRREKSLSRALERSNERLILLEGEPGSGKSVALRHVAQNLAKKASRSKNSQTLMPIYVNLRELAAPPKSKPAGPQLIRKFV